MKKKNVNSGNSISNKELDDKKRDEWIKGIHEKIAEANTQRPTIDDVLKSMDKVNKIKNPTYTDTHSTIEDKKKDILNKLEEDKVIIKTGGSIIDDLKKLKTNKKTYTEEEMREKMLEKDLSVKIMNSFNNHVNREAKIFYDMTKKIEDIIEEDDNPNILLRIIPFDEKERVLFKDKILLSGEKRRPIYITIGDYDFFYEYVDEDNKPIFSFNKKSFNFFFKDNLDVLREYIGKNKCYFSGSSKFQDRLSKFSNLIVEAVEKKKKPVKEEKPVVEQPKEEKKVLKKVYRVKFLNSDPLFILTDNPSDLFLKFENQIDSIKVLGIGVEL